MLTSVVLHVAAGIIAGSLFTIPTLMILLLVLLGEMIAAAVLYGGMAMVGPVLGIIAVQTGYLAGIYARSLLERSGHARADLRTPRTP